MGARDSSGKVYAHGARGHCETPADRNIGVASVDGFAWILGWKQHHHGDNAGAKQDKDKSSQEFRKQLRT